MKRTVVSSSKIESLKAIHNLNDESLNGTKLLSVVQR